LHSTAFIVFYTNSILHVIGLVYIVHLIRVSGTIFVSNSY